MRRKNVKKYWTETTIRTVMCSVCLVCVDLSSLSVCSYRKTAHCLWISGSEYFLQLGKMLAVALESGYTRYSSLSLWYFLELVNVGGCSGHAPHSSLFLARWDRMCNVLVLPVTSSSPRRPRDITSRLNPSCLTIGAVESPRPSICLARQVHLGEVSIHPMTCKPYLFFTPQGSLSFANILPRHQQRKNKF